MLTAGHQHSEVPDESHTSPQQSEPWWANGNSSTGGAEPSTEGSAGGAASLTSTQPPAAEPLVPWGIEFMIIVTTSLTFGTQGVTQTTVLLLQQSFPGMAPGRALALAYLMGSVVSVLLAGGLVKVIRNDWEPPALARFPLVWKPLAQWIPQLAQILSAFVLTPLICLMLLSILPPGPLAEHHAKVAQDQAAMLGQVLGGGDLVAGGLYFLAACVCAPVTEEIVFRGFVVPSLLHYLPAWTAVVASAIILSGAHLSFDVVRLVLGLFLASCFCGHATYGPPSCCTQCGTGEISWCTFFEGTGDGTSHP